VHWFDAQGTPVTVVHAPIPSQVDATLATPAVQLAAAHCFSDFGYWQARGSLPLQTAAQVPVPGQRARTIPRAAPLMVMHLPSWFGSAHA